jgi:RNA polymerase sigma-70 factor, ECF subfamily
MKKSRRRKYTTDLSRLDVMSVGREMERSGYYQSGLGIQSIVVEIEDQLIERAIKRDREAFSCLYDVHVELVFKHVYYHIIDKHEAEDLTQDVFIKAWKAIHKYVRTEAPFRAWLLTIARNSLNDYYKKHKKTLSIEDGQFQEPESPECIEESTELKFDQESIRRAVAQLKGDKQQVILMHFIDGFSYTEIARFLNKTEGAIRIIQFRALNDLKQLLSAFKNEKR